MNLLTISGQFKTLKLLPNTRTNYQMLHAGVSTKYQSLIFRILSAILHMGNIEIQEKESNDSSFVNVRLMIFIECFVLTYSKSSTQSPDSDITHTFKSAIIIVVMQFQYFIANG